MVFSRLFPKLRRLIRREGIRSSSGDMVEVRFALIGLIEGVACTLDGVTKYSDSSGLCYFYGISQGAHAYSIIVPEGMVFVSGYDVFMRPLSATGTTVIEWAPVPGVLWPEDQAWVMQFTLEEIVEPDPFETVYHSTYRGIEIRQYTLSKWYTFTTDMVWTKETLQECYDEIDAYLGPECPMWIQKLWETANKRNLKRVKEYLLKLAERKGCTLT